VIIDAEHPFAKDMFILDQAGKILLHVLKFNPTTGEIWQVEISKTGKLVVDETGENFKIRHFTFPAPLRVVHRDGRAYDVRTINDIDYLVKEQFDIEVREAAQRGSNLARTAMRPTQKEPTPSPIATDSQYQQPEEQP
jgi:hypothetical protein